MAVTDDSSVRGVIRQKRGTLYAAHVPVRHIQVLYGTALYIGKQRIVPCIQVQRTDKSSWVKEWVIRIPVIPPTGTAVVIEVVDRVPVAVKMTAKETGIGSRTSTTLLLPVGAGNRYPLLPVGGVRVIEIGQIDVRRQFDVLASEILFVHVRAFRQTG